MSKHILIKKPVGEILEEAGLINSGQIHVALIEQSIYTHLKLGEILALHGWIDQQTADFFAEKIKQLACDDKKQRMGYYFIEAGLLKEKDIKAILDEQEQLGIKFGSLAVLKGYIKQETLTFFLTHFAPEGIDTNAIQYLDKTTINSKRATIVENHEKTILSTQSQVTTHNSYYDLTIHEKITMDEEDLKDEIIWKG
ncbi:MAG: hypothetical protein GW795_13020 [Cyanobacteria bacterium]|nr:hypothetical protein [Cyanobacteria bacterium CG_2015-16_32_12]NCO78259.1 hypothetical protein [Cyanobacteria bacterium CG_2015-22_32_23]NCQ02896.1 hypothetical protein [Cyanobacteria bacterium CG_2015-09_32_10]NCQ42763.1 hypothetical protein [Cyanobacteria bacterium CG_2015-04_32_10]NCS83485.1 hypothetical protein [Cyanobacteria bacterium CG_2015-02_32_10]